MTNYNYNATDDKPANKAQAMKRQSPGDPPPWCEFGPQFDSSSIGKTPANYASDRDKVVTKSTETRHQIRDSAYSAIDSELKYQVVSSCGGKTDHERNKTAGDYLTLIRVYSAKADAAYSNNPGDAQALHEIRKLAAICVDCMENLGILRRQ